MGILRGVGRLTGPLVLNRKDSTMLVLSRQKNEAIMIGADIRIIVADVRGDKVRIGIEAPATISVHREEIYDRIQREGKDHVDRRH